jgi:site-specific DNA recombinase
MTAAPRIVPAVDYYRMSTARQDDSIDRQRSQVAPYAEKNGYELVAEYIDEGIAGDEFGRRDGLQRLLKDAKSRKFQAVLCDEPSRLSRQQALEFTATVAWPLQQAGVALDTVTRGKVRWDDLGAFIIAAVDSFAAHEESVNKSHRVLSELLKMCSHGKYLGGPVPYGYRLDDGGRYEVVPDKAEVVRLIFRLAAAGSTLGGITRELAARAVPSPSGRPLWSRNGILRILHNRKYLGDYVWGVQAGGKHNRQAKGVMRKRRDGEARYAVNPQEDWVVLPSMHEPIVDRDSFQAAAAAIAGNRKRTTPHVNGGDFLLTGLLACGRCGSRMLGSTDRYGRVYMCSGYLSYGKAHCRKHQVKEAVVAAVLVRKLQEAFLNPAWLDALRTRVRELESAMRDGRRLDAMRRRVQLLERKLAVGYDRVLSVSEALRPGVEARLAEVLREKKAADEDFQRAESVSPCRDLEEVVRRAEEELWALREALDGGDRDGLRRVLREWVSKVELRFAYTQKTPKRVGSKLVGGAIHLRPQKGLPRVELVPYGKSQFISFAATGWAVAALLETLPEK